MKCRIALLIIVSIVKVLNGIHSLAGNEDNKLLLQQSGVLDIVVDLLEQEDLKDGLVRFKSAIRIFSCNDKILFSNKEKENTNL